MLKWLRAWWLMDFHGRRARDELAKSFMQAGNRVWLAVVFFVLGLFLMVVKGLYEGSHVPLSTLDPEVFDKLHVRAWVGLMLALGLGQGFQLRAVMIWDDLEASEEECDTDSSNE